MVSFLMEGLRRNNSTIRETSLPLINLNIQADKTYQNSTKQITHSHRSSPKCLKKWPRLGDRAGKLRDSLRNLQSSSNAINLSSDGGRKVGWAKVEKKNYSKTLQTLSCQGLRLAGELREPFPPRNSAHYYQTGRFAERKPWKALLVEKFSQQTQKSLGQGWWAQSTPEWPKNRQAIKQRKCPKVPQLMAQI